MKMPSWKNGEREVVITGGAGFVGTNLADRLLRDGESVVLFDNFSRPGVEQNYRWLSARHGHRVRLVRKDVRDSVAVREIVRQASSVFHFAAQVAVTTSLENPRLDFETNTLGTLNVLEALRTTNPGAPLVFTSTNKVYGCMADLPLEEMKDRYTPRDPLSKRGIDESAPLDFASPYGCSKGAADQYVLDYARSFGLPAVVFRMSCVYGPHQMGTEDQGWVAHFLRRAMDGDPITIYGDGRQVRDLLFVDDLVGALLLARDRHEALAGEAFNIGGGSENTASIRDVIGMIADLEAKRPECASGEWRLGDQRYYVSDCSKFTAVTGWIPATSTAVGLRRLHAWLRENRVPAEPSSLAA